MRNKKFLIIQILTSVALFFSFIIFFVKVVINFRQLYYFDIRYLKIEQTSGISIDNIKINYDYLINFLDSSNPNSFKLPSLPSSLHSKIHFWDVYYLINNLTNLFYILVLLLIFFVFITLKSKNFLYLKITGIALLLLPFILSPLYFVDFDSFFSSFHKLIFNNNYWLFDPKTDPIILILPEEFFMHCLLLIIILCFCSGVALLFIYRTIKLKAMSKKKCEASFTRKWTIDK